jgi:prevent-host-death family protein
MSYSLRRRARLLWDFIIQGVLRQVSSRATIKLDWLAFLGGPAMEWNLADAKNRFSELVNLALTKGPQRVRRRKDAVVVISGDEYDRLVGARPAFKDFLLSGESFSDLNLERDPSPGRYVKL